MDRCSFLLSLVATVCIIACSGTRSYKKIEGFEYEVITREAEEPEVTVKDPNKSFFSWWGSDKESVEEEQKPEQTQQETVKQENTKVEKIDLKRKRIQLRRNRYLLLQGG